MRICLIVDCYLPSGKSSAKLISDLAGELVAAGHSPVVVTPDDTLPGLCSVISESDGVTVVRVRSGKIKGASLVRRGLNEAMLSWMIWRGGKRYFRENPCDLVVFYSPSIFFGGLVRRLKKLWGCGAYLILRDIFPQWAVDAGVMRGSGPIWKFFRRREMAQYAEADIIAVQSPANLEYFKSPELAGKYRLEVLYNWTRTSEPDVPECSYRSDLGLDGKVVFFYGGNIGVAQDMDNIIRLAEGLADIPQVHFLLVGDGSEVPRLKELIRSRGLDNIQILPAVGQKEYLGMLRQFDVGLISLAGGLTTQNIPGKLLGYMYYSMPVLASINPGNDLKDMLESHHAGLVSLNGADGELADQARRLASDGQLRETMGANSRRLLEEVFSVEKAAAQILRAAADIAR
ncbi:MAG: glycosyltransferase family 4 protein [Phycisphaerae bacterium]|jgi:glycosyltransferase involved in cell wall biosynthesis|nr:glycosyltransferase family 4 protein [Phycisphaerae bacterium]